MGHTTFASTDKDFEQDVLKSEAPVLVDFWAEWCGPCKAIAPKLEEIALEMNGRVKVAKLNIDENPETPAKYTVRGIPTLILFKNGQEADRITGNYPKENIVAFLEKYV